MNEFWDREEDLDKIRRLVGHGAFGYVTGRRRVGKTALLVKACKTHHGIYHQAVEGTPQQQLLHLTEEIKDRLPIFRDITPKSWTDFFALLSKEKLPALIVFDEFPYWVEGDRVLPSLLQKWIDHELPAKKSLMLVSGSSQSMLYSQFLDSSSPLYGRALFHIHLESMSYKWFCKALGFIPSDPTSFERYSLVGGVPHYWKLMPDDSLVQQATALYFEPSATLSEEPRRLIQDENITGTLPKAILDLVGRGISKPSELAARLGTVQGNLSRPLALLLKLGLIQRELPFGESARTTKKVLYSIQDPALAFYYYVYLSFRNRWNIMSPKEKEEIIHQHASRQWELFCRNSLPDSSRYWEGDVEIDLIARLPGKIGYLVAECKWSKLTPKEEAVLLNDLRSRFSKTKLARKLKNVAFKIFSKSNLPDV